MGLGFNKKIRHKNMMIDNRIKMQGKMVDREIKDFMIDKRRTTLLRVKRKKGNIFS